MHPKSWTNSWRCISILNPSHYSMEKYGIVGRKENMGLWPFCAVNSILNNPTYLGHMAQQRWSSISYKNHKRYKRDESEWIVVKNTHEAIITQELWDKVREVEKSVAQGRKTKRGYMHPLSGFLFCADCGGKMKMNYINRNGKVYLNFNCGNHVRLGKSYCFSHFIQAKVAHNENHAYHGPVAMYKKNGFKPCGPIEGCLVCRKIL